MPGLSPVRRDPEGSHYEPICHNAVFTNVVRGFSLVQVAWHDPEGSHYELLCDNAVFTNVVRGFSLEQPVRHDPEGSYYRSSSAAHEMPSHCFLA